MVEKLTWPAYKEAEYMVDIISNEANKTITGKMGNEIQADKGIDDVNAGDYDALFVPSGFSLDLLRINPRTVGLQKRSFRTIGLYLHLSWTTAIYW